MNLEHVPNVKIYGLSSKMNVYLLVLLDTTREVYIASDAQKDVLPVPANIPAIHVLQITI
jgi:hypothetical protein